MSIGKYKIVVVYLSDYYTEKAWAAALHHRPRNSYVSASTSFLGKLSSPILFAAFITTVFILIAVHNFVLALDYLVGVVVVGNRLIVLAFIRVIALDFVYHI